MDTFKLNSMAWHLRKCAMQNKPVFVCAWCDADKTQTKALKKIGVEITHGICQLHRKNWLVQLGHTLQEPANEFFSAPKPS